jgi:putative glycosyltransferase (TIGR04372 family)
MSAASRFVQARVMFDYYVKKIRVVGLAWTARWIARRLALEVLWLALLPATLVAHLLGYRRVPVNVRRIGHLACEFDALLKEQQLGSLHARKWFVLAPQGDVSNPCLLDYWAQLVPVVRRPWQCLLLESMGRHGLMMLDSDRYMLALHGHADYYGILARWADRPALLKLEAPHRARGWQVLRQMGMPEDAWFVCVHAREAGFSAQDETAHAHRNSDIDLLIPAMREIRRRGGWVVRMGDPTMRPLPPMDCVIDYALHPQRSDWMDVFLCAEARFFVGNTSGLFVVATVFGRPCALANMVPTSHLGFAPSDISIPKLIWSERHARHLTFAELFDGPAANFRLAKLFQQAGLRAVENSAQELVELVVEMFDRQAGVFVESEADRLRQAQFRVLLRAEHYCFGTASKLGARFLERHRDLLPSVQARAASGEAGRSESEAAALPH